MGCKRLAPGSTTVNSATVERVDTSETPNQLRDYSLFTFLSYEPEGTKNSPQPKPCAYWWTVNASASEVTRLFEFGGVVRQLQTSTLKAGNKQTAIQMAVGWDSTEAFVDIGGGTRFSVLAPKLTLSLWVPSTQAMLANNPNTSVQNAGNAATATRPGLRIEPESTVLDTLVSIGVTCSESPLGDRLATLTRSYDVANDAGTDVPFPANTVDVVGGAPGAMGIPPRARRVTFTSSTTDNFTVEFLSNLGTAYVRRTVSSVAGILENVLVPKNATVIRFSGAATVVTATWEIEL